MIPSEPIYRPAVPFADTIAGGLKAGVLLTLKGAIPNSAKGFQLNFLCGSAPESSRHSPIAFHFNPRLNERYVARNTFQHAAWGKEEGHSPNKYFPFMAGQAFEIMILVEDKHYKVAVNGRHFITYQHRIPISAVGALQIFGDVEIHEVCLDDMTSQTPVCSSPPLESIYDPNIPFSHEIFGGLQIGKTIYISGRPLPYSNKFVVDLLCSNPCGNLVNVALHINPRFSSPSVVIRNTRINGKWGTEEADGPPFPFEKNIFFDIKIVCEDKRYKVFVNGQHFCAYCHRLPLETITQLEISGDVSISSVIFQ